MQARVLLEVYYGVGRLLRVLSSSSCPRGFTVFRKVPNLPPYSSEAGNSLRCPKKTGSRPPASEVIYQMPRIRVQQLMEKPSGEAGQSVPSSPSEFRNWCQFTVWKSVPCQTHNGTETVVQRLYQTCRWPGPCKNLIRAVSVRHRSDLSVDLADIFVLPAEGRPSEPPGLNPDGLDFFPLGFRDQFQITC
ncbi:hypothetical protein NFI96_002957 [Prochilodus magdalenae]|nr:hypothetical protein NFI96_002957 [Prochilodus magdalenae]